MVWMESPKKRKTLKILNNWWEGKEDTAITILEHIKELRTRIIIVLTAWFFFSLIIFYYCEPIFNSLLGKFISIQFIYLTPAALFITYIKLSMTISFVLISPLLLYQVWGFINPGLYPKEKRIFFFMLIIGSLLFYIGCFFAYKIIIPFSIEFFESFSAEQVQAQYEIGQYLSFVINTMLISGIVFELPLFMCLAAVVGIITSSKLSENRKYTILTIVIVSAVLTPPDVISQMLTALPLWGLFELGLLMMRVIEKSKKAVKGEDK